MKRIAMNRSIFKIIPAAALLLSLMAVSCAGDDTTEPAATITLVPSTLTDFLPSGGEKQVGVSVRGGDFAWSVYKEEGWIEIIEHSDSFTVRVLENTEDADRTAVITVGGEGLTPVELAVKQLSVNANIQFHIDPGSVTFQAEGSTQTVKIMKVIDLDYEVLIPLEDLDWLSSTIEDGASRFQIKADPYNGVGQPRTSEVIVVAPDINRERTLYVTQLPAVSFYISRDNVNFGAWGGEAELPVHTDGQIEWSVGSADGSSWVTASRESVADEGGGITDFVLLAAEATDLDIPRSARFVIRAEDMEDIYFTVTQNSRYGPENYEGTFSVTGKPRFLDTPGSEAWTSSVVFQDGVFVVGDFASEGIPFRMTVVPRDEEGEGELLLSTDYYYPSGTFLIALRAGFIETERIGATETIKLNILDTEGMGMVFNEYHGTMYPRTTTHINTEGQQTDLLYGMVAYVSVTVTPEEGEEPEERLQMVGPVTDFYSHLIFEKTGDTRRAAPVFTNRSHNPVKLPHYLRVTE